MVVEVGGEGSEELPAGRRDEAMSGTVKVRGAKVGHMVEEAGR